MWGLSLIVPKAVKSTDDVPIGKNWVQMSAALDSEYLKECYRDHNKRVIVRNILEKLGAEIKNAVWRISCTNIILGTLGRVSVKNVSESRFRFHIIVDPKI